MPIKEVVGGLTMLTVKSNAHWRDSARSIRFFIWDGQAAFPMLILLLHLRLWTFILAVIATLFFSILNRYGFSVVVFGRWLRATLAGRHKVAIPWWMVSHESE